MAADARILNDEVQVYRVAIVPGGITHPILGAIPDKGCIPLPVTKTGTISTDNTDSTSGCIVRGTGTLFLDATSTTEQGSDFQKNRFLANADGVLRRIKEVNSNIMITLVNPFPASLVAAAVKLVTLKPGYIVAKSVGTADAILQEQDFVVGEVYVGEGSPVSYDVSAANSQIDFSIHV